MQGMHDQIGTGGQSGCRTVMLCVKGQMRAMGFIHHHRQALVMQQPDQLVDLSGITVIRGMNKNRTGNAATWIRPGLKALAQTLSSHRPRVTAFAEKRYGQKDRHHATQFTGGDQRTMGIARQQHSFAGLSHRQQTGLEEPRGTVHTKPAVINTQQVSQPLLAGSHRTL